jgi:hypothetical protein
MKRKFQMQKFNDEDVKFYGSSSLPEGFKLKTFHNTQSVYLFALLQNAKIKQPMLNQVLFTTMQLSLFRLDEVSTDIKYEFI